MLKVFVAGLRFFTMSAVQKPEVLFVLGGPGSGKGTLCYRISQEYGYVHLSAGELLRDERKKPGSQYAELIENHMISGTIVPVEITCSLLDQAMQSSDSPHKKFLIDGFPRNQDNVDGWNKAMSNKCILKGVLFSDCSKEVCIQRCLKRGAEGSGRSDDNEEVLIKRFDTFLEKTMPIVSHFEKLGLLYRINGMRTPKEVFEEAKETLKKIGW